jgi:hypothetical protein
MDHKKIIKKAKEYFDRESPVCDLGGCEFHGQEMSSKAKKACEYITGSNPERN